MPAPDASDAPAALINCLMLDQQWFKARPDLELAERSIDQSICVHYLEKGEMLVIDTPCPTCAA